MTTSSDNLIDNRVVSGYEGYLDKHNCYEIYFCTHKYII